MKTYRITQSLLSAYNYIFKRDDGYADFLDTLQRKPIQPNKAMLDGTKFEGMVNAGLDGNELDATHEWFDPVKQCVDLLKGSQQQVELFKIIYVDGKRILLQGILDFLHAGQIYDTKFSKTYHLNKYLDSPQTAMYFKLVPEAYRFTYVICDGDYVYKESYTPDMVKPIEQQIKEFFNFLRKYDLMEIYTQNWCFEKYDRFNSIRVCE